jgi:hypothetical protein
VGETGFRRALKAVVAVGIASVLASCATVPSKPAEEIVKERSQIRWNLMVQGDLDKAYEYFSPSSRATMSLAGFKSRVKPGFWKAVTVDKVECSSADRCEVTATIGYDYRGTRVNTPHRETWIRDESNWWLLSR